MKILIILLILFTVTFRDGTIMKIDKEIMVWKGPGNGVVVYKFYTPNKEKSHISDPTPVFIPHDVIKCVEEEK